MTTWQERARKEREKHRRRGSSGGYNSIVSRTDTSIDTSSQYLYSTDTTCDSSSSSDSSSCGGD